MVVEFAGVDDVDWVRGGWVRRWCAWDCCAGVGDVCGDVDAGSVSTAWSGVRSERGSIDRRKRCGEEVYKCRHNGPPV